MAKPREIEAVLLDVGEVLIRLDFSRLVSSLKIGSGETIEQALQSLARWPMYDRFERGGINEADFHREFVGQTGIQVDLAGFRELWNSVLLGPVPGIEELLERVGRKVPVYAFSNTNETHLKFVLQRYPFLGRLRRFFSSHEIRARKPERAAFRTVIRQIGLHSEKILFVDDRPENIRGAEEVGLVARLCRKSPDDLVQALESFDLL